MAHKVGEAYFDIFLKLDQAQVDAVRKQIGDKLNRQVEAANARMVKDNADTNAKLLRDDQATNNERSKSDSDLTRSRGTNSDTRRSTEERNILRLRRAESQAYSESRLHNRQRTNDSNIFSRLQSRLAGKFQQDQKNNEGSLHRLATQFRTIGTVARGISIGAAALGGFSLLQNLLGGIIAAGPLAAAGIALIPPAIAAVGVEALIIRTAFRGVGKAISDGMNPAKAKAFQKDLQGLAPAARKFVIEITKAKNILPNIQQAFFSASSLQKAAARLRPFFEGIKQNFGRVATANGNLFGRLFGEAVSKKGTREINDFLGNLARLINKIAPSASKLFGSFINFADRVSKVLGGAGGDAISRVLDRISRFVDKINVPSLFKKAGIAFSAFGTVLKNIGGSIGGIIKAFGGTDNLGKVFFKNIGGLFKEINQFVNSKVGQTFLHQLVGTLAALSGLADKALKDALSFLAGVFAGLYPAIKPFAKAAENLIHKVLTPEFGKLIGKIASDFLRLGTTILNTVTPAISGFINFLVKHPKVAEALAVGIGAIYLALKIGKGVKSLSSGLNDVKLALDFFKNPKKILTGMGEVAAGEDAIGAAGHRGAGGSKALGASFIGKGGLIALVGLAAGAIIYFGAQASDPKGSASFHTHVSNMISDIKGIIDGKPGSFRKLRKEFSDLSAELRSGGWIKATNKWTDGIQHAVANAFDKVRGTIHNFFSTQINQFVIFGHQVETQFNTITRNTHKWWSGFANFFTGTVKNFFVKTVPGWAQTLAHNIATHFDEIVKNVHSWWPKMNSFFTGTVKNFFTSTVPSWFSTSRDKIKTAWGQVVTFFQGLGPKIETGLGGVKTFFEQTVPRWSTEAYNGITKAWNGISGWAGGIVSTLKSSLIDPITKLFQGIPSNIASAFSGVTGTITAAVQPLVGVINTIISGLNSINPASGGKGLIGKIGSFIGGLNPFHAKGGAITGAGGPQDDSIAAMLSNGEFVIQAKWAKKYRRILELINAGKFAKGGLVGEPQGYAFGGSVNPSVFNALNTAGAHKIFGDLGTVLKGATAATDAVSTSYTSMQKDIKTQLDITAKNQHDWRVKQDTEIAAHYKNVHDQTATLPTIFTKPTQAQLFINEKNLHDWRVRHEASLADHYKNVFRLTAQLPSIFTKPTQKEYNTVDHSTGTLWKHVNTTWDTGQKGVHTTVGKLPSQTTTPIRKTYNQILGATAGVWNNVGKNTHSGVSNVGKLSAQLPHTANPGVSGLVSLYSNNIKKVWDSVAKQLKLPQLAAVGFHASAVASAAVAAASHIPTLNLFAAGGHVRGPGGPTSDQVPAWLSNGEFIVNAASTRRHRSLLEAINDEPRFSTGGFYGRRDGTSFPAIEQFVRSFPGGPGLSINATTGGGHVQNSYHFSGEAVDFGGSTALMNRVAAEVYPFAHYMMELIHSPSWYAHDGIAETVAEGRRTYAAVWRGHFGHIHLAMSPRGVAAAIAAKASGHVIGGRAGGVPLPGGAGGAGVVSFSGISDAQIASIKKAEDKLIPPSSPFNVMLRGIPDHLVPLLKAASDAKANSLNAAAAAAFGGFGGGGGGGSPANRAQLLGWIAEAAKFTNIPANWVAGILTIIGRESGGNPNAINRTDSNARAGHPSQGLMQTIPSTFANNVPAALRSRGILDPVANIAAAVNYIRRRYGTIFNVQQANSNRPPKGYRHGTNGARRGWAMVGENGPEMEWFDGGETVIPHHLLGTPLSRLSGYASGTVKKKTSSTLPKSLTDLISNISVNFVKGSSTIQSSADALVKAIDGNTLARKRKGSIDRTIQQGASALKKLADKLGISNATVAARGATQDSIKSTLQGFGDLTTIPFTAGRGAAGQFISGLKSAKIRQSNYTAAIKKAAKLGLSPDNIATLTASADGESIIESLSLASSGELRQINKLTGEISSAATTQSVAATTSTFTTAVKLNAAETKKLTAQMKKLAGALETKVSKQIWVHKASGGFVPRVPGVFGDNVPMLATPGEYITPVGAKIPATAPTDIDVMVYVDGEKARARAVVKENNRSIIQGFSRR